MLPRYQSRNYRKGAFEPNGAAEAFERARSSGPVKPTSGGSAPSDHFHLPVETPEANLSAGMQWLQGTWANRFNWYHGKCHVPSRSVFKEIRVEPGHSLAPVAHYIHLKPCPGKPCVWGSGRSLSLEQSLMVPPTRWARLPPSGNGFSKGGHHGNARKCEVSQFVAVFLRLKKMRRN